MTVIHSYAPGSLMLLGEHLVLFGCPAIAFALNKGIHIRCYTRSDKRIQVHSQLLDRPWETDCRHPTFPAVLTYVEQVLQYYAPAQWPQGLDIHITSDIPDTMGLGSSAAVTVALHRALREFLGDTAQTEHLFTAAQNTIRQVQGKGSGADAAASIAGHCILLDPLTNTITPTDIALPIRAFYLGYKTGTSTLVHSFSQWFKALDDTIQSTMLSYAKTLVNTAWQALINNNLPLLAQQMQLYSGLQFSWGLHDQATEALLRTVHAESLGSKVSGSGLGDCIIALYESLTLAKKARGAIHFWPAGIEEVMQNITD